MLHVLYLDFDGVLHHDAVYRHPRRGTYIDQNQAPGRRLFQWAGILEEALERHADVKIVLSTTWVQVLGYSRAVKRLPPALQGRVIGATYHSVYSSALAIEPYGAYGVTSNVPRGEQVLRDVKRRRPAAWVAVDDTDEGWTTESRDHLVLCRSSLGLSDGQTQRGLVGALERHFGSGQ